MSTFSSNETWSVAQENVKHLARSDSEHLQLNGAMEDEFFEPLRRRTNRIRQQIEPGNHETAGSAFTELMLHPEKLAEALKNAERENELFEASRKFTHGSAS